MLLNIDRSRQLLREEGFDGVISSTVENNYYLSGVWFQGQELFPHDGESYVVATTDRPEAGTVVTSIGGADEALTAYETVRDVITFGTFFRQISPGVALDADEQRVRDITEAHEVGRNSVEALVLALEQQGLDTGALAVDERGPNHDLIDRLTDRLPRARFKPGSGLLRRIRSVKTAGEVERLVATLRVTEQAFRAATDAFKEGVTERQLKAVWDQSVLAQGARPVFCLVRFGRGIALGQVPAGDTPLQKGGFAFFDMGCDVAGYKSDIGRIVSLGDPDEELQRQFDAIKAGQQAAIDLMAPGAVTKDVFGAAVEAVRQSGIPDYQRHHVGHGIGIEVYDNPVITPNETTLMEAGMVFEVETPYYQLGVGGSFLEDTVVVRDGGAEILTELERELIVVDQA